MGCAREISGAVEPAFDMRRIAIGTGLVSLLLGCLLPGAGPVHAGELPLFRHALLNLPAGKFEVVVFHRGVLDESDERLVNVLRDAPETSGANLDVFSVDLVGQVEERLQLLWDSQTNAAVPWLVVRPPGARADSPPMWTGPLTAEKISGLLDSPARRKIAEGLVRGDAAVWVLLESGDAMRDEAAVDVLAAELKAAERKLNPSTNGAPIPVSFSLVRVTRNDPAEDLLVGTLVYGDRIARTKPTAYPVFGRGRVSTGLTGRHLDDEKIRGACAALTGIETNTAGKVGLPSKELLLSTQWDALPEPQVVATTKTNASTLPISPAIAQPAVASGSAESQEAVPAGEARGRKSWIGLAVLACALIAAVSGYLLRGRRTR